MRAREFIIKEANQFARDLHTFQNLSTRISDFLGALGDRLILYREHNIYNKHTDDFVFHPILPDIFIKVTGDPSRKIDYYDPDFIGAHEIILDNLGLKTPIFATTERPKSSYSSYGYSWIMIPNPESRVVWSTKYGDLGTAIESGDENPIGKIISEVFGVYPEGEPLPDEYVKIIHQCYDQSSWPTSHTRSEIILDAPSYYLLNTANFLKTIERSAIRNPEAGRDYNSEWGDGSHLGAMFDWSKISQKLETYNDLYVLFKKYIPDWIKSIEAGQMATDAKAQTQLPASIDDKENST